MTSGAARHRARRRIAAAAAGLLATALLPPAVAGAAPVRYEAENATISQGLVESDHPGFTGTGFVNYDNLTGSYVEWTVTAAAAGPAPLVLRFANGTAVDRPMDVAVNGAVVAAGMSFPSTGTWENWQQGTVTAALRAGANTVRATATTANGGPNVDSLTVGDPGGSRVIPVSSIAALQAAADRAAPGDRIELADGAYNGPVVLRRSGTDGAPVTIAAAHVGRAEIRGSAGFTFSAGAANLVIEGFRLTHGGGMTIPAASHHVRVARNTFQAPGATRDYLVVEGNDNEIDHNTFQNKTTEGVFLQISGPGERDMSVRNRVHHNYFTNHTFGGANGGESIRLGFSFRQLGSARATIEYNLFERANGDSEAISVKSADNTVRYNTLRNSRGSIVLRHGNRNLVEGNIMLGGSAGVRFYDNDHVVINNLIQGGSGQIIAGSGTIADDTTGTTAHARADRVLVAFNTVVANRTNLIEVGGGGDRLGPDSCVFANNILVGGGSGGLVRVGRSSNLRWQGNIIWAGTGGNMPSGGFRRVDPALMTDPGGLRRLSTGSPAVNAALGSYPQVLRDLDLQERTGAKDTGADELVAGGAHRRALTTADVGPLAP